MSPTAANAYQLRAHAGQAELIFRFSPPGTDPMAGEVVARLVLPTEVIVQLAEVVIRGVDPAQDKEVWKRLAVAFDSRLRAED